MWEYFDEEFTRGMLPLISFEDFMELSNYTITTALMLDWLHDNCRVLPAPPAATKFCLLHCGADSLKAGVQEPSFFLIDISS